MPLCSQKFFPCSTSKKFPVIFRASLQTPRLKPLLKYVIEHKIILNEHFESWHQIAKERSQDRYENMILQKLIETGAEKIIWDDSDIQITDEDKDWNFVESLLSILPSLRNRYAHGSTVLHNRVLETIQIAAEIINQVYSENTG